MSNTNRDTLEDSAVVAPFTLLLGTFGIGLEAVKPALIGALVGASAGPGRQHIENLGRRKGELLPLSDTFNPRFDLSVRSSLEFYRRKRTAVIITTNLPFSEWPQVFPNARLCKTMLDRLTDSADIIETGTESFRFRRTIAGNVR